MDALMGRADRNRIIAQRRILIATSGSATAEDAAEFTHQIVMVSLFRNVAFRVTTFFNMILRVSLKWWVGGPLCFNHSKASDGGLTS